MRHVANQGSSRETQYPEFLRGLHPPPSHDERPHHVADLNAWPIQGLTGVADPKPPPSIDRWCGTAFT